MANDDWLALLGCRYCGHEWEKRIPKHHGPRYTKKSKDMIQGLFFAPETMKFPGITHEECKVCGCYAGIYLQNHYYALKKKGVITNG